MTGRAIVIGGGISGLVAAFDLTRAGWQVTVHEATGRWGGRIFSSPVGDRMVDAGPDAFLARVEHATQLCRDLGLDHLLTSPQAAVPAYLFTGGSLHPLPEATMLGVPTDLEALRASKLISPAGIERAAQDLTINPGRNPPGRNPPGRTPPGGTRPGPPEDDISVGALCRRQLGDEVTDRLIDPLIGAINASDIDRLSLRAAAPQLASAWAEHGSLIRGMAALRAQTLGQGTGAMGTRDPNRPVFHGLPGGTAMIIERLVVELEAAGADLRLESKPTDIRSFEADAIIVAVPAYAAAELMGPETEAGQILGEIEYADVSQVVAEWPVDGVDRVLDASGILFPRQDGRLMTACTWLSTKWAHYQRDDSVLLRLSTGRFGDERHHRYDDQSLLAALTAELSEAVPITGQPTAVRVGRWRKAFPQYTPGHHQRVAAARRAVADLDQRFELVGAAYDGIGVPACIASARAAAQRLATTTDHDGPPVGLDEPRNAATRPVG